MHLRADFKTHLMRTEHTVAYKLAQSLARVLTTVFFDLKIDGHEHIPRCGGALIVSNHQSYLDPVLLAARLDRPLNYIAKSELFDGVGGWLLRTLNAFPVRQGAGDIGAVRETIQRLREGHLLNIYPEGARTPNGQIAPLKRGVALIIRRAQVPVVPTVIVGSYEAWPIHRRWWRLHPIHVVCGPPMQFDGLDEDAIIAVIDQTLHRMFDELRAYALLAT